MTTLEGLACNGKLHPMQQNFLNAQAYQCGFCTAGMIMTSATFSEEDKKDLPFRLKGQFLPLHRLPRHRGCDPRHHQRGRGLPREERRTQPGRVRLARSIVTGQARYTADIKMEGMLHLKVAAFPACARARIKAIRREKALAVPGVARDLHLGRRALAAVRHGYA